MAVFTALTRDEIVALLGHYALGRLIDFQGIERGIENSNFFLTTDAGRFVLTVFERLTARELPFYLGLMQHLARRRLPVPLPAETDRGSLAAEVHGKPVAIVSRVPGRAVEQPSPRQCELVGGFLGRLHLEAQDFPISQPNPRGLAWWKLAAVQLRPHLPEATLAALLAEIEFQDRFAHEAGYTALPSGPIHADLFRDNVLFESDAIGGAIDFYFAGRDTWLYDLAVTLNDWCVDLDSGEFDLPRAAALMQAYHAVRPLTAAEHRAWRGTLRAAALRFWVSRLHDLHLPRPAALLRPHDPARFERMLRLRIGQPALPWV